MQDTKQTQPSGAGFIAAESIIKDLANRNSLRQVWESIDRKTQADIKHEWALAITEVLDMQAMVLKSQYPTPAPQVQPATKLNLSGGQIDAEREAFEKWVKSGGSKYTCERYSEHCYAENTVNISWNAWQAARTQQPALSEDIVRLCEMVTAPYTGDPEAPSLDDVRELADKILAANALPVQPKVTREEIVKHLCTTTNLFTNDIEEAADAIAKRWPHIVGE